MTPLGLVGCAVAGAVLCALLILALRPVLARYALARPNARSSHVVPTPQGAGIAVLIATLIVTASGAVLFIAISEDRWGPLAVLALAAVALAVVGGIDDLRPLPAALRLVLQAGAAAAVVTLALWGRVFPEAIPLGLERLVLAVGLVWFVNLVNFMDGIDWITAAQILPIVGLIAGLGWAGIVPAHVALIAAALGGAMLGFAPFNKPVARLFLGDVGSLPIGLLTGWMLIELAARTSLVTALLPPLYSIADTGLTLARRVLAGERVWEAHRSHFYQRATGNGLSVLAVDATVLLLNMLLAALALASIRWPSWPAQALCLALSCGAVAWVLRLFAQPRSGTAA